MLEAEVNRHVADWSRPGDRLSYDSRSMLLRVSAEDASVTIIEVTCPEADRVVLVHGVTVTPQVIGAAEAQTSLEREALIATEIRRIVLQRSALLSAELQHYSGMIEVSLTYTLFCDGLTQHAFMLAVREIERTKALIASYFEQLVQAAETRRLLAEFHDVRPGDLT